MIDAEQLAELESLDEVDLAWAAKPPVRTRPESAVVPPSLVFDALALEELVTTARRNVEPVLDALSNTVWGPDLLEALEALESASTLLGVHVEDVCRCAARRSGPPDQDCECYVHNPDVGDAVESAA